MGLNLKTIPTGGGGGFFKPEHYVDTEAFLIEVNGFEHQRPGQFGPKDSVLVDMTVFATREAVDAGEPTEIRKGMRIEYTVLTRDLHEEVGIGGATIVQLAQHQSKRPGSKPAWVWRQVSLDIQHAIVAYAEKRDAERDAAIAAAPDFD